MSDVLVVLARAPRPGEGKTRLRRALRACHPDDVDALVRALAEDTLAWASGCDALVVAGCGDPGELRAIAPFARHVRQRGASFGARIENAITAGLATGGRSARVVQIGTDSPTLPHALVDAAFSCLHRAHDAALVPALDGGWVANAVARPLRGALASAAVRWSTEHAAADTIAALRAQGRRVTVLPPWYDVDDLDGLHRLQRDRGAVERAPRSLVAATAVAPLLRATG